MIEASQAATITELLLFSDAGAASQQMTLEQPCFKLQVIVYEPLELVSTLSRGKGSLKAGKLNVSGQAGVNQSQLLSRHFENITINLNQSLACELDVSVIDRLYYLINDIGKYAGEGSSCKRGEHFVGREAAGVAEPAAKKFQNFEVKCSQVVKVALRFPIADLRRAQSQVRNLEWFGGKLFCLCRGRLICEF